LTDAARCDTSIQPLLVVQNVVDGVLARAEASGASLLRPAEDQWWGVRGGSFRDLFGHRWSVHTVIESVSAEEMQRRADELGLYPPPPEPKAVRRSG
jgi:PhnB protein